MILDKDGNGCSLYCRSRDIQEYERAITFNKEACRWIIQGDAAEVRRTDERSTILDALLEGGEPMKSNDIATLAGMRNGNVRQLLMKMSRDGQVVKTQRGLYVHPDIAADVNDDE